MMKIIGPKYCRYCRKLIPKTRKRGSFYCTNKCGYTFRNKIKASERKKLQELEPALYKNRKVVKDLVRMGILDVTFETAKELGMDFNAHMGVINFDQEKKTTKFRLFNYSFTICDNRIKIKKLTDECT